MAVESLEWWKNATDEEKKKLVKERMILIKNFEDVTKKVIETLSQKHLFEARDEIEANKECLEYIKRLKENS